MSRPVTRADAERQYRELRRLPLADAQARLVECGVTAELRAIDAGALQGFGSWTGRRVAWPWPPMVAEWRQDHPNRFELAIWKDGVLCGLALGRPSAGPSHLSLYYMEGNPDPGHPLRDRVTAVTLAALSAYCVVLGKRELRLVESLPELVSFYCSPPFSFELVTPKREAPYCRMETMNMPKAASLDVRPKGLATTKVSRPRSGTDTVPSPEQAAERLQRASSRPQPWLEPAGLEAAKEKAELVGPSVYRKR